MFTQQCSEVFTQILQKAVPEVDSFEQELYTHILNWKLFSTVQNTDRDIDKSSSPPPLLFSYEMQTPVAVQYVNKHTENMGLNKSFCNLVIGSIEHPNSLLALMPSFNAVWDWNSDEWCKKR